MYWKPLNECLAVDAPVVCVYVCVCVCVCVCVGDSGDP